MTFKRGDWVEVRPVFDVPLILRPDGKPTRGRVQRVDGDLVEVWVLIGGADVDVHSQAVPYEQHMLRPSAAEAKSHEETSP